MKQPRLKILSIDHHRNGIDGAPFNVVLFEDEGPDASRMLAVVFGKEHHCAVLDVAKVSAGDITFGSNSWRGDIYERVLREAIKGWEHARDLPSPSRGAEHKTGCKAREENEHTEARTHICNISLNGTQASVFEVADQGSVRHEVELETPTTDSYQFAYMDVFDVCNTTGNVIRHVRQGHSLDSFISEHSHEPGDTPEVSVPHGHKHDHEITR
jgi:hypothetical protein